MCLRKSDVRSHLLDVQETNFSFTVLLHPRFCYVRCRSSNSLDLWDSVIEVFRSSSKQPRAQGKQLRDKHSEKHSNAKSKKQSDTQKILAGQMLITSFQTQNFLTLEHCFVIVKTMKQ